MRDMPFSAKTGQPIAAIPRLRGDPYFIDKWHISEMVLNNKKHNGNRERGDQNPETVHGVSREVC